MAKWPTDKELEEIYRKGSEQHNFDYDAEAWSHMEDLLDRDRRRRWFVWFFFGVVIIALISLFYLSSDSNNKAKSDLSDQTHEIVVETDDESNQSHSNSGIPIDPGNEQEVSTIGKIDYSDKINETRSAEEQFNQLKSQTSNPVAKDQSRSLEKNVANSSIEKIDIYSDVVESQLTDSNLNPQSTDGQHTVNSKSLTFESIDEPKDVKSIVRQLTYAQSLVVKPFVIRDYNFTIPERGASPEFNKAQSSFNLFALVGVESSQTPSGNSSSLDSHVGLGVGYFFNNKIGINLAASYVYDSYKASSEDYKPPAGFWEHRGNPQWTNATCDMLETSLGVSCHFTGLGQKGVSLNSSLISNVMLSEHYYYHFENQSENFASEWTMANGTLFSSLSIAANYNFPIKNNWSVMVGPYAKIPLRGIGHGDVMLSSFGMRLYFSLGPL